MFRLLISVLTFSLCSALLALPASPEVKFEIEDHSPGIVYRVGQQITLYCRVTDHDSISENDDWKNCVWLRESGQKQCRFDYVCEGALCGVGVGEFHIEQKCDEELADAVFFGDDPEESNHLCGIRIPSAELADMSPWFCIIEECKFVGCGTSSGNGVIVNATSNVYIAEN